MLICPECGARQRRQTIVVRCAHCHHRASLELTVCPNCGRTLRPAGPRWLLWGIAAAGAFLLLLWGLGKLPTEAIAGEIASARTRLGGLVEVLGPVPSTVNFGPTATPVDVARVVAESATEEAERVVEPTMPPEPVVEGEDFGEPLLEVTEVVSATLTVQAGAPEITGTPVIEPTATPTTEPATTPTPSPTATVPPTPAAVAGGATYRVRSGDSLYAIALQYGVTVDALRAANGLAANAVLRIGQELKIPGAGGAAASTATLPPKATSTAVPPAATALPEIVLPAPVLLDPADKASYSGQNAMIVLSWEPVPGMPQIGQYQVTFQWLEQGARQDYWVRTTQHEIRFPPSLWSRADQPSRSYEWTVQVVQVTTDGKGGERVIPLSPASASRQFYWN